MAKKENWAQKLGRKAQMVIHGKNYATVQKGRQWQKDQEAKAKAKAAVPVPAPKAPVKKLESAESMAARAKAVEDKRAKRQKELRK